MTDILIELPDGTFTRKPFADLLPDDRVVFDGPDAFALTDAAKADLDAEFERIVALHWKADEPVSTPLEEVNIAQLSEALAWLGVSGDHCSLIAANIPRYVNDLTLAVVRNKERICSERETLAAKEVR